MDGGWVLPHRPHVGRIKFNGGCLLNQVDRHDEIGAPAFAKEDPSRSLERPLHYLPSIPSLRYGWGSNGTVLVTSWRTASIS